MQLLIVIVNYKTPGLTIDCLASIESQVRAVGAPVDCKVVLTDNLSPDDSVAVLQRAIADRNWSSWVDFRPLPRNGGFAYGNNEGIRPYLESHKPEFILLLNPDTIARPGAIDELLKFMRENPRVGIAGSRLEHPDTEPQRSAFRFPGIVSEWLGTVRLGLFTKLFPRSEVAPPQRDETHVCDWVAGASMIIRREVIEKIGLLDDRYFMYFEEVDFCLRAKRAGFDCMYVPASRVVHLVGQASGVTDSKQANKRRPAYWFESRRRYFVQNHGTIYTAIADLTFIAGFTLWKLRRIVQRKPDPDPAHFLGDFIKHSVFLKGRP
jgi:N-acetylglucosaminyl-diphospho-decaprenol L-rhamnosyltransferase